jgi:hypothetical protein
VPAQPVLPRRPRRVRGPVRRRLAVTALLAGLAVATGVPAATGAAAAGPDTWSSSQGGPTNARTNPGESSITAATAASVAQRWSIAQRTGVSSAPVVVGGTVYAVDNAGTGSETGRFVAASAVTGAVLWTTPLTTPAVGSTSASVDLAVSGRYALLPYLGNQEPGGLMAVDLTTRALAWSAPLPPASIPRIGNDRATGVVADGTRAYVIGAGNAVNAYRLTDGALLWTATLQVDPFSGLPLGVEGLALDGTVLFSSGGEGLTARDAVTGRVLWTGPGATQPVVAGGRVFTTDRDRVFATAAGGCGRSTCPATWTRVLDAVRDGDVQLGAADASTLFVSYSVDVPSPTDSSVLVPAGTVARLDAATGAVQRTITAGAYMGRVVRGGDTVWVVNTYYGPQGESHRVLGFPALGTGTTPLRTIDQGPEGATAASTLAIGGGTLVVQNRVPSNVTGYRADQTTPAQPSPIQAAWLAGGGAAGPLGAPTSAEQCGLVRDGCRQVFARGTMLWSAASGAKAVRYALAAEYTAQRAQDGRLGYPVAEEGCGKRDGGCSQEFQGGTELWSSATGAHTVYGALRDAYRAQGWENGRLGYPVANEGCGKRDGGCSQEFQGGTLLWSPTTGARAVYGALRDAYRAQGWENGRLGYPVAGEGCGKRDGGCSQEFQGGTLLWSRASGAHAVVGTIRERYRAQGWENGRLGYPVTDPATDAAGRPTPQRFQGGTLDP